MSTPVRDSVLVRAEKKLAKMQREIVQRDKRLRRTLQSIDLAIEHIMTGMGMAELAERHNLAEDKVRRSIDKAIFLARSRLFEKTAAKPTATAQLPHSERY